MNTKVDEGKLISGKEALIALANGEDVDACVTLRQNRDEWHWFDAKTLTVNEIEVMETDGDSYGGDILEIAFRLKPRTISINGVEAPSIKKESAIYRSNDTVAIVCESFEDAELMCLALRQVFGGSHDN